MFSVLCKSKQRSRTHKQKKMLRAIQGQSNYLLDPFSGAVDDALMPHFTFKTHTVYANMEVQKFKLL